MKRFWKWNEHRASTTAFKVVGIVTGIGMAVIGFLNIPDLVRYWRMRSM